MGHHALAAARTSEPLSRVSHDFDFEEIYDSYADFVWRSIRRLGVDEQAAEDLLQEVFVVVHRRLSDFEARSSMKTWLFGIVLGVVRNHRRSQRRRRVEPEPALLEIAPVSERDHPDERSARAEAVRVLYSLLDALNDEQREAFVMAELEGMQGTEIADATGVNLNTVYARLRAARREFDQAVARMRAREGWRSGCR